MSAESLIQPDGIRSLCEMAALTPPGSFVEVGVYKGGSAYELAKVAREQCRPLYLYDTFTGIPYYDKESGDSHRIGDFNDTSADAVRNLIPDAIVIPGIFPDSMHLFNPGPVAFAHIDADQYQSIKESISALWPIMVDGGVMLFDDYKCLDGATLAVHEVFGQDLPTTASGKAYAIKDQNERI